MSDSESTENAIKSPYKSPVKTFGWLFGNSMETFDDLLPIHVTTSASTSTNKSFCPTKQNVIQHWMACVDKNRDSYQTDKNAIIWEVTDNLIEFWNNNSSLELR